MKISLPDLGLSAPDLHKGCPFSLLSSSSFYPFLALSSYSCGSPPGFVIIAVSLFHISPPKQLLKRLLPLPTIPFQMLHLSKPFGHVGYIQQWPSSLLPSWSIIQRRRWSSSGAI